MAGEKKESNLKTEILKLLPSKEIKINGIGIDRKLFVNEKPLDLESSLKVSNKSPKGFNWGYNGSGPQQAALALLLLWLKPEMAMLYMQGVVAGFISLVPGGTFEATLNIQLLMSDIIENGGPLEANIRNGNYFTAKDTDSSVVIG